MGPLGPISRSIFKQFLENIWPNNRLAPRPGILGPPLFSLMRVFPLMDFWTSRSLNKNWRDVENVPPLGDTSDGM